MMEGKPIDYVPAGTGDSRELRRLEWGELVARFAAARDFRVGWHDTRRSKAGSFADFANRPAERVNAERDFINHAGSEHGKTERAKTRNPVNPADGTDGIGN